MKEAAPRSVLLIGGPDAGKSNFLFRLWLALDQGNGIIVTDGMPAEIEYLRTGAEALLEGTFAAHTPQVVYERAAIPVKSAAAPALNGILIVPDLSGEKVLAVIRDREWSTSWEELVSDRCACLLFVRAGSDQIVPALDPMNCFQVYGGAVARQTGADNQMKLPTQVVLIEWLQFVRRAFTAIVGGSFCPRIGMIVSAWDAVPTDAQPAGPSAYLKANFPMLQQFIEANIDQFNFQTFGLSIVGGDLKSDDEFKKKYAKGKPKDFGFVVHSLSGRLATSTDITLPVAWALGIELTPTQ